MKAAAAMTVVVAAASSCFAAFLLRDLLAVVQLALLQLCSV